MDHISPSGDISTQKMKPAQVSITQVESFLEHEKDQTRRWFRSEMDQLVEQMFGQLREKFFDYFNSQDHGGPSSSIDQPDPFHHQETEEPKIKEPEVLPIKQEIEPEVIEIKDFSPVLQNPDNENFEQSNYLHDSDDEENCDCDDCQNGGSIKLEDSFDAEDQQDFDYQQNQQLMDIELPQNSVQIPQFHTPSVSNQQKCQESTNLGYRILGLKCWILGCGKEHLDLAQLDQHLAIQHGILKYRCFAVSCGLSFADSYALNNHLQTAHPNGTELRCSFCPRRFASPNFTRLESHITENHHSGIFRCGSCTFTCEFRHRMAIHLVSHREVVCDYPNCGQRFKNSNFAKAHKRAHLGIEPFRCKWPGCSYSNSARSTTMNHIWRIHFKIPDTKRRALSPGDLRGDPKDFLEINRALLH